MEVTANQQSVADSPAGRTDPEGRGDTQRSSQAPLRVGIIGMGRVGERRARFVNMHPDMELLAICDVREETASRYPQQEYFQDYHELIRQDLDVVFVCAYNNVAPTACVESLNSGKHVFCEKPPGTCVDDVQKIIAAEQANPGLKLKFGFNHRYHYAVMEAKAMVESGRYGNILWIRGVYGKCGSIQFENEWRNDAILGGGGILLDQGIHMLDLFRLFLGDFRDIRSMIATSYWKIPNEDNAFAILANDKNQIATIHSSATQWKHRFGFEICLEKGYINLNGILSSTRSYGDESITFARAQFEDTAKAFGRPREETIYFDQDDSWKLEVDEFARLIREDQPVTSGNSEDALKVMELIDRIYTEGRRA